MATRARTRATTTASDQSFPGIDALERRAQAAAFVAKHRINPGT